MILLNILCRYWYIYFYVSDKKNSFFVAFSFFFWMIIDQTCLLSNECTSLCLYSLFFSHSGQANMGTTSLPFTELIESFVYGISRGVGVGKALNKCLYEEAPPRGPTPYPFIYHFPKKGTPFMYPLLTNGTPFTYLVQNFASLSTAVNALSFK